MGGNDAGPVEVDETFVGGKLINMHEKDKRERYKGQPWASGKIAVVGMVDRELRQVRANVVRNVRRDTLQSEILNA